MALVDANNVPHTGVYLPPKPKTPDAFWSDVKRMKGTYEAPQHVLEFYDQRAPGGQQSYTDRTVRIHLEGSEDCMAIGARVSTTVSEIGNLLAMFLQTDPNTVIVKRRTCSGTKILKPNEEVPSTVIVAGLRKLQRDVKHHEHPIVVVGAGLGGIQCMVDLLARGRSDIVCMDRNEDFGGHSWIRVPNKFTKLQTERGTYHVDYTTPGAPVPTMVGDMAYKTWPSRDSLLAMMREGAKTHGLYQYTHFQTHIERVMPKHESYAIQYFSVADESDAELLMTSAVSCWPGFLHDANTVEFPGEDEFGGYIEYSSFDKVDYDMTVGKVCIMYGHGAFTIENVRTLCEHRCKKVTVICRTRNLSGMKMASWLVGAMQRPLPALVLLDAFKRMYDLVGYDCWSCYSVKTDADRTFAQIEQKTIFGVTDIYFLAGYYGLMEVVEDTLKRLTYHTAHTRSGLKVEGEVLIKAIGTAPSARVDRDMGIKEIRGFWVNGDPLRPIATGTKGVQAKNFGTFSVGPGFAPLVKILNYFIDYTDDWFLVRDKLPTNKAGTWPAFVVTASYGLPVFIALQTSIPMLAQQINEANDIKHKKQNEAHPLEIYLGECKKEWESYISYFRKYNMVDDRPDPPYPYTLENMLGHMDKANRIYDGQRVTAD